MHTIVNTALYQKLKDQLKRPDFLNTKITKSKGCFVQLRSNQFQLNSTNIENEDIDEFIAVISKKLKQCNTFNEKKPCLFASFKDDKNEQLFLVTILHQSINADNTDYIIISKR